MKKLNKLFILVASLVIALLLVGCDKNKTEDETKEYVLPTISNPDEVVYTKTLEGKGTITVTKDEAYAFVRYSGGITLLLQQLDDMLLSSYVSQISTTDDFYMSRYNRMVYDTTDEAEINEIKADEAKNEQAINDFNKTLEVMGYETETEVQDYIKTLAARDKFAYEYLKEHADDRYSDYKIEEETLADYYLDNKYTTCKAIVIAYANVCDFEYALENAGFAICGGMIVNKADLEDAKTKAGIVSESHIGDQMEVVTEEETSKVVFYDKEGTKVAELENVGTKENFIKLYNASTPYTLNESNITEYNYQELSKGSEDLAEKVFSLKNDEYTYNYVSYSTGLGTMYCLIYKVDGEVEDNYAKLDDTKKDEVLESYIKEYVQSSSNVTEIISDYRKEQGIEFYDIELAYEYSASYDTTYDFLSVESDGNKIVSIEGEDGEEIVITADDYCDYALGISKEYYAMSAAIVELEQYLPSYSTVYGEETDIEKNSSQRKASFRETIDAYVEENYDEDTYGTKEVYLYDLVGFDNIDDIVKYYYAANDLKSFAVLDTLYSKDEEGNLILNPDSDYSAKFQEVIDDYINNYYSIYAYELTLNVDTNGNFIADEELNGYDDITDDLKKILSEKMDEELKELQESDPDKTSLTAAEVETVVEEMVEDYNETSKFYSGSDETLKVYASMKGEGFIMSYSQVNSGSVISYAENGDSYTDIENAEFKKIYDAMVDGSITSSSKSYVGDFYIDTEGIHLLFAKFGTEIDTFKYTATECEEDGTNKLAINEDGGTITLAQAYGSFYNYLYDAIFTDAETAEEEYGITEYPTEFPEDIDLSAINEVLASYFLTDSFVNKHFANDLSLTEGDYYAKAKEIYAYFLDSND